MVGTLIGLISMLSRMESPDEIGAGMAVALVCTFYGALLANLVFLPLGGKLGQYSKAEKISMEMIAAGVCAIAKGDNPTAVREKMQCIHFSKTPRGSKGTGLMAAQTETTTRRRKRRGCTAVDYFIRRYDITADGIFCDAFNILRFWAG